jgi:hypothetical protein
MTGIYSASLRVAGASGAIGLAAAFIARKQFVGRLDALDQRLAAAQNVTFPRTDLPPEVARLATRLGANSASPARFIELRQSGAMWLKPEGRPLRFTARQRTGTSGSGFVWRARIGPFGATWVVDSFVAGRGFLEARLFGAIRLAHIDGTVDLNQGEALRYLAELPLNPDAILFDHALAWSVVGPRTISVSMGHGESLAAIVFELNDAGQILTANAASRAFDSTGKRYPWHGRFWDYQGVSGRCIPMQAEVAWIIDGKEFVYWRGKIESWLPVNFQRALK